MASEVKNPCISVCLMENGVCTGCGMTNEEITKWPKISDDERRKILARLEQAKAASGSASR